MSDSIAILDQDEVIEKKRLLGKIIKSAKELKSGCNSTASRFRFFDIDDREEFEKYSKIADEIIDFCNFEATHHIKAESIIIDDCNGGL